MGRAKYRASSERLLTWQRFFFCPILAVLLGALSLVPAFTYAAELAGANSLRAAIDDLAVTFGDKYGQADQFRQSLAKLEQAAATAEPETLKALNENLAALTKQALTANPLVSGRPLLFVVRKQYAPDHHNTATLFQNGQINSGKFQGGGAIKLIDLGRGGKVTTLLDVPDGIARDPELSYDGSWLVFSMRKESSDDYHIYRMNIDGTGLTQLTSGGDTSDIDPVVLPDDTIIFSSTREPKLCQCNRHIMANLFRMNSDGSQVQQIGRNSLFEGHPVVMNDGLILYDRWEYVDRHFGPSFGLWTTRPDGGKHELFFGNNSWTPGMIADARPIPGTNRLIATYGSCHDRPWGALAIIDPALGSDGKEPVVRSWPADISKFLEVKQPFFDRGGIDRFKGVPVKYEDPLPLSDKYFLCSRNIGGERMAIYLLDVFGNETMLHAEGPGCYDPMPVVSRRAPATIAESVDLANQSGLCYVDDVYRGSEMETVPGGTVKWLRVIEVPPKLYWTNGSWNIDATQAPAMNWNSTLSKKILGQVPVEKDGSAYFSLPADRFVYFQLLDSKGQMVQSMRSGTTVRPGETVGCTGCHASRHDAPPQRPIALALNRAPSKIEPWYGSPRDFNYLTEVQPVWNRHCVSCHDYDKPAGDVINLAADVGLAFNTSYVDLRRLSPIRWHPDVPGSKLALVKAVDDGPPEILPPYAWGSHRSRLVSILREGHYDVKLSSEDMDRVVTWIDLNAPYYGSYASLWSNHAFGRSPLGPKQLARLKELTGVNVGSQQQEMKRSQVSFFRPEKSPCLDSLRKAKGDKYEEALAIIRSGTELLAAEPRADLPGSQISGVDAERKAVYDAHQAKELQIRKTILQSTGRNDVQY